MGAACRARGRARSRSGLASQQRPGASAVLPFLVSVVTVLYFDLRIRKEGFDVELLAQDLNYPPLAALGPFLPPAPAFGPTPARLCAASASTPQGPATEGRPR